MGILGMLGSSVFGSIFGGIAGLANKWLDLKQHAMDHEQELALRRADMEQTKLEIEGRTQVAAVQVQGQIATADAAALAASLQSDKATYGIKSIDFIRGIVRPLITSGACVEIFIAVRAALTYLDAHGGMTGDQAYSLIDSTLFTCFTVILWWFGSRPKQK